MKVTRQARVHLSKKEVKKQLNLQSYALPTEESYTVVEENWATGERKYLVHAGREGQYVLIHEWTEIVDEQHCFIESEKPGTN